MQVNHSTPGGDPRWGVKVPNEPVTVAESFLCLLAVIGLMVWMDGNEWLNRTVNDYTTKTGDIVRTVLMVGAVVILIFGVTTAFLLIQALLRPPLKLKQAAHEYTCWWPEYRIKKGAQLAISVDKMWVRMDPKPGCAITLSPGKHTVMLCTFAASKDPNTGGLVATARLCKKIDVKA